MRKIKQGALPDEVMEFALVEMQKILLRNVGDLLIGQKKFRHGATNFNRL